MKRSFQRFVRKLDKIELRQLIEERALALHVSLRDLYEGPGRAPSITAARRDVYSWLYERGKGVREIARLFDRAPSGVGRFLRMGDKC
ncbi:hypothetical protein LCGC14_2422210, partial [marine sediment metagenome]